MATLALVFGFASSAKAGMCDQYEVVPTCTGSGPGSAVNFYNTTGSWNTWNGTSANTNGNNGYYNGNNYNNNGYYNGYNNSTIASVTTNNPTQVGSTSINLSGYVQSNTPTTAFFQYGTDQNMNRQTNSQSISNGTITNNITGLLPNTTYYFRLIADNQAGRATGNTMSITTSPVIYNNTNTGNTGSVSGTTKDTTTKNTATTTNKNTNTTTTNNTNTEVKNTQVDTSQGSNFSASSLSALSISGENSFLPDTVFEWICVFFLILVIILLIRQLRPKADHGASAVAHH